MKRFALIVAGLGVLTSCDAWLKPLVPLPEGSVPDAGFARARPDAGAPVDAGGSGCQLPEPAAPVTLDALAEICAEATEGWRNWLIQRGRASATACGETVEDRDIAHLRSSGIAGIDLEPNCRDSSMARELSRLERSVDLGRVLVHADRIALCQAQREGPHDEPNGAQGSLRPECRIMEGVGAIGDPCDLHEECAGFFCRPTGDQTCGGVCAERLPNGADCSPGKDRCAAGNCKVTASGKFRCTSLAAAGERCDDIVSCNFESFCSEGLCRPKRSDGGACARGADHCDDNLVCVLDEADAKTGICRKRASEGEACGNSRDGNPPCADRCLRCEGHCLRRGLDGERCTAQRDCVDDAYCEANFCRSKPRRGESCVFDADLPRGNCAYHDDFCLRDAPESSDGVCTARPTLCQSCAESLSCATGRCQTGPDGDRYCFAEPEPPPEVGAPLGAACESHGECSSSFCNPASARCTIECASGCQGNLLDTYGFLVFYGLVVNVKRRRER